MMSHDPFQSYQAWGPYSGGQTPYGFNPMAQYNPWAPINPLSAIQGLNPLTGLQQFGHQGFGPQGFGPQGFGPQGFGPQGFGPQGFGHQGFGHQGFGQQGIPGYGGILPQLQLGGISPYGGLQNPLLTSILQNPLVQQSLLQNPLLNPILAQGSPYGNPSPYGQQPFGQQQPFAQQLQPQTWLGQPGIHPLQAYLGGRQTPWA